MEPGSIRTLANYLTEGYWNDTGGRDPRWFDMDANDGVLLYNVSGFAADGNGLSASRQEMVREAFKVFEFVLGIDFQETASTGGEVDFFFRDTSSGASHSGTMESGVGGPINFATINLGQDVGDGGSEIGGRAFQSAMHEIGHGLGLGHQGTYNGDGDTDIPFWSNDSWQVSMMSYLDQGEAETDASFAYLLSPMIADWLALNDNYEWQGYGVANAFAGDTVWGFNTTIAETSYARLAELADENAFTIVDGSGNDTVDFSGFAVAQTINLSVTSENSTTGAVSNIGGLVGNMLLAVGTVIENAVGGARADTIFGNSEANLLQGRTGKDAIYGKDGADVLVGGVGADALYGGLGADVFRFRLGDSTAAKCDVLRAADGGAAFDGAGAAVGDLFDFTSMGNLNWGGTDRGSIYLKNVGNLTHCYVNTDFDRTAEVDIAISDGSRTASQYTVDDFLFA